jgi:hypothetical protein
MNRNDCLKLSCNFVGSIKQGPTCGKVGNKPYDAPKGSLEHDMANKFKFTSDWTNVKFSCFGSINCIRNPQTYSCTTNMAKFMAHVLCNYKVANELQMYHNNLAITYQAIQSCIICAMGLV